MPRRLLFEGSCRAQLRAFFLANSRVVSAMATAGSGVRIDPARSRHHAVIHGGTAYFKSDCGATVVPLSNLPAGDGARPCALSKAARDAVYNFVRKEPLPGSFRPSRKCFWATRRFRSPVAGWSTSALPSGGSLLAEIRQRVQYLAFSSGSFDCEHHGVTALGSRPRGRRGLFLICGWSGGAGSALECHHMLSVAMPSAVPPMHVTARSCRMPRVWILPILAANPFIFWLWARRHSTTSSRFDAAWRTVAVIVVIWFSVFPDMVEHGRCSPSRRSIDFGRGAGAVILRRRWQTSRNFGAPTWIAVRRGCGPRCLSCRCCSSALSVRPRPDVYLAASWHFRQPGSAGGLLAISARLDGACSIRRSRSLSLSPSAPTRPFTRVAAARIEPPCHWRSRCRRSALLRPADHLMTVLADLPFHGMASPSACWRPSSPD